MDEILKRLEAVEEALKRVEEKLDPYRVVEGQLVAMEAEERAARVAAPVPKCEPKPEPKPEPTWSCPTCGKRFAHGTQCAHWYFDSQVALGPLPRNQDGGDDE